jgi:hypothetical protein
MATSGYVSWALRRRVAERARSRCEYCGLQEDLCPATFEVDHIIPRALDGATEAANLCYACPVCNNAKRSQIIARDPRTGRRTRLFDPRRQRWGDHFRWSSDGGRIVGKTMTGRATVQALEMNRPRIVHVRLLWAAIGLHPPKEE